MSFKIDLYTNTVPSRALTVLAIVLVILSKLKVLKFRIDYKCYAQKGKLFESTEILLK